MNHGGEDLYGAFAGHVTSAHEDRGEDGHCCCLNSPAVPLAIGAAEERGQTPTEAPEHSRDATASHYSPSGQPPRFPLYLIGGPRPRSRRAPLSPGLRKTWESLPALTDKLALLSERLSPSQDEANSS